MIHFFEEAFNFIDTALLKNENVLIHCMTASRPMPLRGMLGVSRSLTLTIAYLIRSTKDFQTAFDT